MAHGNIYPAEKIDAALGNYFRVGNLTALRELALLWLADKVDEQLDRYRAEHGIAGAWETRERVVVALTGGPEGDTLIRRAARIAARTNGADLLAVHVARSDGLRGGDPAHLARAARPGREPRRHLPPGRRRRRPRRAARLRPRASTPPSSCSAPAAAAGSAQLVGAGRRGDDDRGVRRDRRPPGHPRGRRTAGPAAAALPARPARLSRAPPARPGSRSALRRAAAAHRRACCRSTATSPCPATSCSSCCSSSRSRWSAGCWPALLAAVAGFAAAQLLLHPAAAHVHHRRARERRSPWSSSSSSRVAVSAVVDPPARRTREAARARAEAETLSTLAGSVLRGERAAAGAARPGPRDVRRCTASPCWSGAPARVRTGRRARRTPGASWPPSASSRSRDAGEGDAEVARRRPLAWCCAGTRSRADDRRVLEAFAAQAAVALRAGAARRAGRRGRRRSPRSTGCAPRCSPRSATTCAPRSPRPRPRSAACAAPTSQLERGRPRGAAGHRRRVAGPAQPGWSTTCST